MHPTNAPALTVTDMVQGLPEHLQAKIREATAAYHAGRRSAENLEGAGVLHIKPTSKWLAYASGFAAGLESPVAAKLDEGARGWMSGGLSDLAIIEAALSDYCIVKSEFGAMGTYLHVVSFDAALWFTPMGELLSIGPMAICS